MSSRGTRRSKRNQEQSEPSPSAIESKSEPPSSGIIQSQAATQEEAQDPRMTFYPSPSISHLFMQFFFSNQCVTEQRLTILIETYNNRYTERVKKEIHLATLLSRSNRILRPIGFQIKRTYDPIGKEYYYVLANEIDDKLNHQNTWSQRESAYYYVVLDEIMTTLLNSDVEGETAVNPDLVDYSFMSIGSNAALNLSRRVNGMSITMTFAEKLLKNWIQTHWFEYLESNKRITLGIRSLAVMSNYLQKKFSIFLCYTCNFTCLIGIMCPKCQLCIHFHCLDSNTARGHPCPSCNVAMNNVNYLLPKPDEPEGEQEENDMEE